MYRFLFILLGIMLFSKHSSSQIITCRADLEYLKNNIYKIENGKEAYSALLKNAEFILTQKIDPVTNKGKCITNNKNDYLSVAPYWWPNDTNSQELPYIRKDGLINPITKNFDNERIKKLFNYLRILTYAYYLSSNDKYAKKAVECLEIWFLNPKTRMNPNLNYAQIIPGNNQGRSYGLIETYNLIHIVDYICVLSDTMDTKTINSLKKWFENYLDWILSSDIGKSAKKINNNHGISYDVQITSYALFIGKKDIALPIISAFGENRLFKQIDICGRQHNELNRTKAITYSAFNLNNILDMCHIASNLKLDIFSQKSEEGISITNAINFLCSLLEQGQDIEYEQITSKESAFDYLTWVLRRSTYFEKNTKIDSLFKLYNKTPNYSIHWLIYAKDNT